MTEWINVGVLNYLTRVPTKKQLKELVASDPGRLRFDVTAMVGPRAGQTLTLADLQAGQAYQVAGPNPYTSRKWYATVKRTNKGITVT